jgi:hypothetical protein
MYSSLNPMAMSAMHRWMEDAGIADEETEAFTLLFLFT